MKKTILIFGLISGAISSLMMLTTTPFMERIGFDRGEVIGYTTIVLSFLLVYFGIRSYRDNLAAGQVTFAKAFAVGICITLISCACYVITWEILYFGFPHGFMDQYAAHMIDKARASGASDAAIQAQIQQMAKFKQQYENPVFNILITFIEPFPIGLGITILSAAILRTKKPQQQTSQSRLPAS